MSNRRHNRIIRIKDDSENEGAEQSVKKMYGWTLSPVIISVVLA